jgi:hypothetical protein
MTGGGSELDLLVAHQYEALLWVDMIGGGSELDLEVAHRCKVFLWVEG